MNKMQAAAEAALSKVKAVSAMKAKDDDSADTEQQTSTDPSQGDTKGYWTPLLGKTPRGSIQRESAFVLDRSLSNSTVSSKLRKPSVDLTTTDTIATSENDTLKLPNFFSGKASGNEVWKDEISEDLAMVGDLLMDTQRSDSTRYMTI